MRRLTQSKDKEGIEAADLGIVLPLYAEYLRSIGQEGNARRYVHNLKRLSDYFDWRTTADIPPDAIAKVRSAYPLTAAYPKQLAIVGFLRWAGGRYRINEEALAVPLIPSPKRSRHVWTVDVEQKIFTALRAPQEEILQRPGLTRRRRGALQRGARCAHSWRKVLYPILLLCLHWAVRRREIIELRVGDWDPSQRRIRISRSSTRRGQSRCFRVDDYTAEVLDQRCAERSPSEPLFSLKPGRQLNAKVLGTVVRHLFRKIGLKGSFQQCHDYAVRSILERMKGREAEAFLIIGFARRSQARLYEHHKHREMTAQHRARTQSVFDDVACHFRTSEDPDPAADRTPRRPYEVPDFSELIRPLLKSLQDGAEGSPVLDSPG